MYTNTGKRKRLYIYIYTYILRLRVCYVTRTPMRTRAHVREARLHLRVDITLNTTE